MRTRLSVSAAVPVDTAPTLMIGRQEPARLSHGVVFRHCGSDGSITLDRLEVAAPFSVGSVLAGSVSATRAGPMIRNPLTRFVGSALPPNLYRSPLTRRQELLHNQVVGCNCLSEERGGSSAHGSSE